MSDNDPLIRQRDLPRRLGDAGKTRTPQGLAGPETIPPISGTRNQIEFGEKRYNKPGFLLAKNYIMLLRKLSMTLNNYGNLEKFYN